MKLIKTLILMLVIAAMMLSAVACADGQTEDPSADTTTVTTGSNVTNGPIETLVKDNIPDGTNFKNAVCKVLYWEENSFSEYDAKNDGTAIDKLTYARNMNVEERLKIEFKWIPTAGNYNNITNYLNMVSTDVKSGLEGYDICSAYSMSIGSCAVNGFAENLSDFDIIDFSAPWWPENMYDSYSINDVLLFATGDISVSYIVSMRAMFFNKDMAVDLGLGDIYENVMDNTWTWDRFAELCDSVYSNTDGDDAVSDGDTFGFVYQTAAGDSLFDSGALSFTEQDAAGNLLLAENFRSARATDFYDFMQEFLATQNVRQGSADIFSQERALFTMNMLDYAQSLFSGDNDVNFGILPLPKYDEAQEYRSCPWVGHSLYMIPKSCDDNVMASTVLEAMASESYRSVSPQLYEVVLKVRYANDETTGSMIDIIRDSIAFDISRPYTKSFDNDLPTRLCRGLVIGDTAYAGLGNLASAMGTYKDSMDASIRNIVKVYNSYE